MEARQFKVCVLGDAAVGKSSLISAFIGRSVDDHLQVRSGAQIEVGRATTPAGPCELAIWDILGADGGFALDTPYLTGMHGYLIVCDRTRRPTLTGALALRLRVEEQFGALPLVLAINKCDREQDSEITRTDLERLAGTGLASFEISATSGRGVTKAFTALASLLVPKSTGG